MAEQVQATPSSVIPGLVPGIHVDGRNTPGHDDAEIARTTPSADAIPVRLRHTGTTPRQVLAMALIGTLVLTVFAARDLSSWLDRMGSGPRLEPLQHAAATWDGVLDRIGLGAPAEALRSTMRRLLDWQW